MYTVRNFLTYATEGNLDLRHFQLLQRLPRGSTNQERCAKSVKGNREIKALRLNHRTFLEFLATQREYEASSLSSTS